MSQALNFLLIFVFVFVYFFNFIYDRLIIYVWTVENDQKWTLNIIKYSDYSSDLIQS